MTSKDRKIKKARIILVLEILVQVILCFVNMRIFGIFGLAVIIFLFAGLFKINKNRYYWVQMQRITLVIMILELLIGLPLFYIFENII